ncbi:ankyrin-1 isoform x3 [Diplodia corticola]|uniref:Ankyrin-1 isoform x3 n=1 Tax=Diplodia corticola TaxID=236234 RepID=A0A1J9QN03_9PEZI|nr:ankyrin-1 isoform x3 [Diplodia corticola]OJD29450.1 ankyrin-1 isoform x3 [Diplodia corticola]
MAQMVTSELQTAIAEVLDPVNWGGDSTSFERLSDEAIEKVEEILRQHGDEDCSTRPRTYAFLYLSHLTRFHAAFRGYSDDHLPYTDWTLPPGMRDKQVCKHFLKFQYLVISEQAQESGPRIRKHVQFANVGDCPLRFIRHLGYGGSAVVDAVQGKYSGMVYARKSFYHRGNAARINSFRQELELLKNLQHRHLVRYIGSYTDPKWIAFTMIPVAEGDLSSWLPTHLGDPRIQEFFGCLASAVAYLHTEKVRHKDIKPHNVLVSHNGIFLSDFGTSNQWKDSDKSATEGAVAYAFTKRYAPLEVLTNERRSRASDIFSLGCIFLELISAFCGQSADDLRQYLLQTWTGVDLYADNEEAVEEWVEHLKRKNLPEAHLSILDMTHSMMDADKNKRPGALTLVDCILNLGPEYACRQCHQEPILQYLESKGVRVSEPHARGPALCEAAVKGNLDIFQNLLKVTDDLSCTIRFQRERRTPVDIAALLDHDKIVQSFLSHCRHNDICPDTTNPLRLAISSHSNRSVKILLAFRADSYAAPQGLQSDLYHAAYRGSLEFLKMVVKRGIDLSHRDSAFGQPTLLHGAVQGSNIETLNYLLAQGLDVNAKTDNGTTPIHEAAMLGTGDTIALLVKAGADPRLRNREGYTAAGWATQVGNLEALKAILELSGPEDHYSKDGWSPLYIGVRANHVQIVEMLLKETPWEINHPTHGSKETPLHYAAQFSSEDMVRMLLALPQASTRSTNSSGATPLRVAMDKRQAHDSVLRLLAAHDPGAVSLK